MPGPARAIPIAIAILATLVASLIAVPAAAAEPVAAPQVAETPSVAPTTPAATTDADLAHRLATGYADALLAGRMADAWALLQPESHERFGDDLSRFTGERRMYLRAADGRMEVGPATQDPALLARALRRLGADVDLDAERAWVVELEYPALAWAPSPDDLLLAAPDATGTWRLWWVR